MSPHHLIHSTVIVLVMSFLPGAYAANPSAKPQAITATVHVCIDTQGRVAYQSMPCTEGQRTRDVRSYATQAIDPAISARSQAIEREMDRRNRGGVLRMTVRGGKPTKVAPDPCKAAKAKRKAMLDRAGAKRGYALLEEIDREVWGLCRGL